MQRCFILRARASVQLFDDDDDNGGGVGGGGGRALDFNGGLRVTFVDDFCHLLRTRIELSRPLARR